MGNTPSSCRHCHKKKGIEEHSCSRHVCPKNLPRGQCHPQHSSIHMGNGPCYRNLPYLPMCFSCLCIEPLCPGCDHSMLCTNHSLPCLVDPMISIPCTASLPPVKWWFHPLSSIPVCTWGLCGAFAVGAHPCLSSLSIMAWCISPSFQSTFVGMSIISVMMWEWLCVVIVDQVTRFPSITSAYIIVRLL